MCSYIRTKSLRKPPPLDPSPSTSPAAQDPYVAGRVFHVPGAPLLAIVTGAAHRPLHCKAARSSGKSHPRDRYLGAGRCQFGDVALTRIASLRRAHLALAGKAAPTFRRWRYVWRAGAGAKRSGRKLRTRCALIYLWTLRAAQATFRSCEVSGAARHRRQFTYRGIDSPASCAEQVMLSSLTNPMSVYRLVARADAPNRDPPRHASRCYYLRRSHWPERPRVYL